jgi:hypothetical protein
MLLSTTAFAATTQTVTKYTADGLEVTSTISGLKENSMVTYLAVKGEDQAVSENGDNIVYIGQKNVPNTGIVDFGYKISDTTVGAGVYATVKCGSSVDTIEDTNTIEVGSVTVTWDEKGVLGTPVTKPVGKGEEVDLTLVPADGSEIVKIVKNNKEELDPFNKTVKATAGDKFVVTAIPTTGDTAAVYQLAGAKVELDKNFTYEKVTEKGTEKVYTNSGIVRVIGNGVKTVSFTFVNDDEETYVMNEGTDEERSVFVVSDLSVNGGYYGVEIEDTKDISGFKAVASAADGDDQSITVNVIE